MTKTPQFRVGERVTTHYSGTVTEHTIIDVDASGEISSQSGVLYSLKPKPPTSPTGWLDEKWLRGQKDNQEVG